MGEFSLTHILFVLILFLIFFGPSKLPGLGQSLGKAIRNFKQSLNEIDAEYKPTEGQQQQPSSSQQTLQSSSKHQSEIVEGQNSKKQTTKET